jgi:uncharacterized membrane protein YeaQ/YmgE (transglycosylase-associated protein family)
MKTIFGILFAVIGGLIGARFAGWLVDALLDVKRFASPDQVDQFDLVAKLSVTLAAALIGAFIGLWIATMLRSRFIRRES